MTQIERMPRPTGVTILAQQMNKAKSKKVKKQRKEKLISHIVNIYTMSGFRLNNRSLTIPQLAALLNTKEDKIKASLLGTTHTLEAFRDPQKLSETAAALANMSTLWAIQDRGTVQSQLEVLLQSQQGKYTPFLSGEISRLLTTLLQSNKQVAEVFRTFYASGSTININNQINNQQQTNALTIEEAYKIVSSSQPEIKTTDVRQAKILPPAQLDHLLESTDIDFNILQKFEHLDNSIAQQNKEKRKHLQIQDVEPEYTLEELKQQLLQEEDTILRQRIQDKILTKQKLMAIQDTEAIGAEADNHDQDQAIDNHDPTSPKKQENLRTSKEYSISTAKNNTKYEEYIGLGSGIPVTEGVSVSDQGCNQAVSGCKDQAKDNDIQDQGNKDTTGPKKSGTGKGPLRALDNVGQIAQEVDKPIPIEALKPILEPKTKGPKLPTKPKKKKATKYTYRDDDRAIRVKEDKAQRHEKSLNRRGLDVVEDDSLPNRS